MGNVLKMDTIREVAFGSITASYTLMGTATTVYPRVIIFKNTTNVTLYFSLDGVNNMIKMIANSYQVIDGSTNHFTPEQPTFPKGTTFYVKYASAPASGDAIVELMYAQ